MERVGERERERERERESSFSPYLNTVIVVCRDQPNSREKMCNFRVEFLKYAKFHRKFMEGV